MRNLIKKHVKRMLHKVGVAMIGQEMADISSDLETIKTYCRNMRYQTFVAPDGLPIPPPDLHALVSGNPDSDVTDLFVKGRLCADWLVRLLEKNRHDLDTFRAVLDFGCGCGRVLRHFHFLKNARLCGTDYNPMLIDWCRRNLPFAEFKVNHLQPPLDYDDGEFDLVYAYSVFTHLPEALQDSWMKELGRILAIGTFLLISTHGERYTAHLSPAARERFQRGDLIVTNASRAGQNACTTYHPFVYVRDRLAKGFEIVEYVPGHIVNAGMETIEQDVYLLKKVG
jgi:SAM-dependent methyltransferase